MKYRPFFAALGAGAAVMLLLPWMAVHFVKGDAGMAVCFLLFFGVNPLFSLAMGVFAGKGRKKRWSLPLVTAALFLAGTWFTHIFRRRPRYSSTRVRNVRSRA